MFTSEQKYVVLRSRGQRTFAPYVGPISGSVTDVRRAFRRNGYHADYVAPVVDSTVTETRGVVRFDATNGVHWTIEVRT